MSKQNIDIKDKSQDKTIQGISKQDLEDAHLRISPYIHRTPILSSKALAKISGCSELYLKCENLQKVGAFKARGAFNKLLQLTPSAVCTHSSGNHAQAVALAASVLGR